jgi:hypothetical protein
MADVDAADGTYAPDLEHAPGGGPGAGGNRELEVAVMPDASDLVPRAVNP